MHDDQGPSDEERQLALLVSHATEYAIFMLDPEGVVVTWNPGAERMIGYAPAEIIGRHFSTFYTEEDKARDHPGEELQIATSTGRYEEEGWRVCKDGSKYWASVVITAIRDEAGTLIGFGKVSRDLTARRLVEEQTRARALELEAANRQLAEFRRLVTSVRDYAIFMLDPAGHVLSWNAGARRLKGYAPEEIIGRHFSTFYTEQDRARNHPGYELEVAVREGRYEEEGWRVRKDGTTFWASVTITAIRDDEGRLTGFAKVTRDLTERKRAQDALQDAIEELRRINTELDRFASVAAHDMADPLRTISGFAEILLEADLPEEERREYAQHVLDSSVRLSGMLEGLLNYARSGRDAAHAAPVALAEVVSDVCRDLSSLLEDREAHVEIDVPAEARVVAEAHDIRLVLQNLVSNGVKFGSPQRPVIRVGATRSDGAWNITVEDNGAGVAEPDRERIFEAFHRASNDAGQVGYGLGLAICQRLIERHGGQLELESEPGRGARFTFQLRASDSTDGDAAVPV